MSRVSYKSILHREIWKICFILIFNNISAQSDLNFSHVGLNDGLNDLTVNAIVQDSLGVLYFGTENGLNIFDGNKFESYYARPNANSISSNTINTLLVGKNNKLWIGNASGVDVYTRKDDSFKTYKINGTDYGVQNLFQDSKGRIFIGTFGAGLNTYNSKTDDVENIGEGILQSTSISSITEDLWGNIWFGTEYSGLYIIDNNTQEIFSFNNDIDGISKAFDFSKVRIRSLCPDKSGNMFIGTYDDGIYWHNYNIKEIERIPAKYSELNNSSKITSIVCDANDNIWIATDGDGLYFYNRETNSIQLVNNIDDNSKNPSTKSIRSLSFDKDKTLWLGTFKGGANYCYEMQRKAFKHYKTGFRNRTITSFLEIAPNELLIGTDGGGLYYHNLANNKLTNLNDSLGFKARNILCLHRDIFNSIWVGTYDQGLIQLDKSLRQINLLSQDNGILNINDIRAIDSDSNKLYIATNGGGLNVLNFKDKTVVFNNIDYVTRDTAVVYNYLGPVLVDSKGYIWAGTYHGITRYNPNNGDFINISPKTNQTLASYYINCIQEDSQGYIWFGTNEGLSKLKSSIWDLKEQSEEHKLNASDFIFTNFLFNDKEALIVNSISEDSNGNLWLGTNKGLKQFNVKSSLLKGYYSETGINIQLFNARASYKLSNNKMLFGGNNGFICFLPDEKLSTNIDARPILTSFLINLKEIQCGKIYKKDTLLKSHINYCHQIRLKPWARIFSVEFGASNSFLHNEIEYAYKLQDFDKDWNYTGNKNKLATYSNLDPGSYIFMLKCRYSYSEWNENIRELKIEILPPFYKTLLFKIFSLLFLFVVLYLVYLQRIRNLRQMNVLLEKQVNIKSKEILEEKELKLKELEKNKALLFEKEKTEKEKLLVEKEMELARNAKLSAELNLKTEKENAIKAELSASLAQISKKNDLFQTLKNELNHIVELEEDAAKIKIKQIVQKIESETFFKDDWHKFETHFNVVYADFIQKLKQFYPDLTRKELRLCSYLRMNLSTNEIAQLSNITLRGVEKSRSRLRKKLNLEPEDDLNDFIINF